MEKADVIARDLIQEFDSEYVSQIMEEQDWKTFHRDMDNSRKPVPDMVKDVHSEEVIDEYEYGVPSPEEINESIREKVHEVIENDYQLVESGGLLVQQTNPDSTMSEIEVKFIAESSGMLIGGESDDEYKESS